MSPLSESPCKVIGRAYKSKQISLLRYCEDATTLAIQLRAELDERCRAASALGKVLFRETKRVRAWGLQHGRDVTFRGGDRLKLHFILNNLSHVPYCFVSLTSTVADDRFGGGRF